MRLILLALPPVVLLAACEKAVTVVSPQTYPDRPVTSITVRFSNNFKPGTFRATLDGKDITNLFAPAPAPGGQSTAELQDQECGYFAGQTAPAYPPPPNRAVGIDTRQQDHSPSSGVAPAQPQAAPSAGSASPVPPPPAGLTVFWHWIDVDGSCTAPRICEGEEKPFLPLHLVGVPLNLPILSGSPSRLQVGAWPKSVVPLPVKVKTQTPSIRLNGGAPGAATSTIVPAGGLSDPITVEAAVRPSQHITWLCSPGVQRGLVKGSVN